MDLFTENLGEILSFLGGFVAGGLSMNFFSSRQSGRSRRQEISRNKAGGDIVGGNKTEK